MSIMPVMRVGIFWAVAALMAIQPSGCTNTGQIEKQRQGSEEATGPASDTIPRDEQKVDWSQAGSAAKKYTFVLDDVSYDRDHQIMGRFVFRHRFAAPLRLFGFGFDRPNQLLVRFETFRREESGRWADVRVWTCGTGAQTYELKPDTEYVLLVSLSPFVEKGTRGQVGVPGTTITVVSDPFETDKIQEAWKSHTNTETRKKSANNEQPKRVSSR